MKSLAVVALLLAAAGVCAATVGFEFDSGRPIVEVTVNGEGPFPFVFDTGAPALYVMPALVERLGLETVGSTELASPLGGEPIETATVRVDTISIAGRTIETSEAAVLTIDDGGALGMGVVGPALFRGHGALEIDFAERTLTIGATLPGGGTRWIPFGDDAPLLDVPIRIGDITIPGHLDTGSPGVLTVPASFVDRLPLSGAVRTIGRGRTVNSEFEIRGAPIEAIARVGDAEIPLTQLRIMDHSVANLGSGAVRGLTLHVDWVNERFALRGTATPEAAAPRRRVVQAETAPGAQRRVVTPGEGPRFGISARPGADGAIEIFQTEPGSPAETIGLRAGDRIVAVNGKSTAELDFAQIRAELVADDLKLTVERDGERLELRGG